MTVDEAGPPRAALVDDLARRGWLQTTAWRAAFDAVPRHLFLPRFFRLTIDGSRYEAVDHDHPDWMSLVYGDNVATTQLDGDDGRWEYARRHGPVEGRPTSSSTQPSLMASMLEALDVEDGDHVLEVGTGTGYNAALLAHRVGAASVVSIEYDAGVARRADRALASAGYRPTVLSGDGGAGCASEAPYDRVIATYSVRNIPAAWLAQLRSGGVLVASLHRDLHAGLLVRLTAGDDGGARGHLLENSAFFMPTRTDQDIETAALIRTASGQHGEVRGSELPGPVTDGTGWTALAALLMPGVARIDITRADGVVQWLVHSDGSWAYYDVASRQVEQGGRRRLWSELEDVRERWLRVGAPERHRLGITVSRAGEQRVWVDEEDNTIGPAAL